MLTRLPEEIQVDIFLRLPVKSIMTCRCACKPLCRLLYNPKFIKYHLLSHKKRNSRLMLISLVDCYIPYPTCRSIDSASIVSASSSAPGSTVTCDGVIPLNNNFFQRIWDLDSCIEVVGSCNGLICLSISDEDSRFCIWNPSTGEHKILSCFHDMSGECSETVKYGFGYDSHLDDYKLLKIVLVWVRANGMKFFSVSEVEIYTLGSKSYKTIQTLNPYMVLPPSYFSVCLLNGAVHWPGFINATSSRTIVSFDISCETYMDFLYPEEIINLQRGPSLFNNPYDLVGLLEDRLCLILYGGRLSPIDVWVMQDYGVRGSWTKQFSLKRSFVINYRYFNLAWSFANGTVLLDVGKQKILYDPKNGSTKVFKIRSFDRMEWCRLVSYVESLISLKKSGPTFGWLKEYNEVVITKKQRRK